MHTRYNHTTSAWRNTHTSHTRAPTAPRVTIQPESTTSITPLTQSYNILQQSKAKKSIIFNNGHYTTNIPTDPYTITTTDIKTNMCHIHTSIVSRHLATRGNNKIYTIHLHHTLAALKRHFPASLVAPFPNSEQINHPSSNHIYTKSTPNHIHHHYSPSVTLTHTTHIISSTAPTYAPHCHPWICGQTPPVWLHCWPDERRSWLVDHKRDRRTPPLARVMGVGRQQQNCSHYYGEIHSQMTLWYATIDWYRK